MAKVKTYTVKAEQIIASKVWEKGDIITDDELDSTVIKRMLATTPPGLVEVTEEPAPAPGG